MLGDTVTKRDVKCAKTIADVGDNRLASLVRGLWVISD
jgi:hypothetical protein